MTQTLFDTIHDIFTAQFRLVDHPDECIPIPRSMVEDTILNELDHPPQTSITALQRHISDYLDHQGAIRGSRAVFLGHLDEYFPSIHSTLISRVRRRCKRVDPFQSQRIDCYLNVLCIRDEDEEADPIRYRLFEYLSQLRKHIRDHTSIHSLYTIQKKLARLLEETRMDEVGEVGEVGEVDVYEDEDESDARTIRIDIENEDPSEVTCHPVTNGIYEGTNDGYTVRIYDTPEVYVADVMDCDVSEVSMEWHNTHLPTLLATVQRTGESRVQHAHDFIETSELLNLYVEDIPETKELVAFERHGMKLCFQVRTNTNVLDYIATVNTDMRVVEVCV